MFAYNPMRLNIGSIGYCSSHHEPGLVSPDYVVFRCDMKRLDPEFLKYYIQSAKWRDWTEGSGVGSVRVRIYYRELARMPVTLPPVDEQRAIADIMGTLDNKIELNRRMNETLEAMERTLFKSWFVDFDPVRAKAEGRDPGLPKPLADLFPDSFEDSELGEIPKGWTVGTLNDVADHPRRGIRPSEMEPTTPYIALEHMPKRCIALSEWSAADGVESNKFKFKKGEILFGKLRPYFHKVGVAPLDGVCSTDIVVVAPRAEEWFGFVLGHISSDTFVEHTNAGSTGTKMPRTSWSEMARYPMVVPPESVAKAFTFHARPVANHIIASIHESRTLATLRDTLLPKLISGKLRVQNGKLFRVQRS
jgi:type I restriction enzyme, S subunit